MLSLSSNNLTGDISNALSNVTTKIVTISLSDNLLEGTLGDSFCQLSNLGELFSDGHDTLSFNFKSDFKVLSMMFLLELFHRSILEEIFLDNNKISGNLDGCIGTITNMKKLFIFDNDLTGTIPSSIGGLPNLSKFLQDLSFGPCHNLSYNSRIQSGSWFGRK